MRRHHLRFLVLMSGFVLLAGGLSIVRGQVQDRPNTYDNSIKFNSGQGVQPVFEGWARQADGTVNLHFGYLNRNWVEMPVVAVGPNNNIQPGGPDRGQPTFFYTRTQRNLFTINVPRDASANPNNKVTWTITVNGVTASANGWQQVEWEIDNVGGSSGGGRTDKEFLANKFPELQLDPAAPVTLSGGTGTGAITATITDDGLPAPRKQGKPAVGQETPPILVSEIESPVNLPHLDVQEGRRPDGLTVEWITWRGPAQVKFDPKWAQPTNNKTTTTATFTRPGEYVLQATGSDGQKSVRRQVSVTVK
jgi:hypothetical protein